MEKASNGDHRTRVAIERRERMRARLIDSALQVFAKNGVGPSAIQQVIATAKVSQGSFYTHFRTNEELLEALSDTLNNELLRLIETEVGGFADPARRIACGLRLYLQAAKAYPQFARFVCAAGLHAAGPNNLFYEFLPPHIADGLQTGQFCGITIEEGLDIMAGTMLTTVLRLSTGDVTPDYPARMVAAILRGMGMTPAGAAKLVALPLGRIEVAPDSLLGRSNAVGQ